MKAETTDILCADRCFVPPRQRDYSWDREAQWDPLRRQDIEATAALFGVVRERGQQNSPNSCPSGSPPRTKHGSALGATVHALGEAVSSEATHHV